MYEGYYIGGNVTGFTGIVPGGLKPRNLMESLIIAATMGPLTLYVFRYIFSGVIVGVFFVFLCLIPSVMAFRGLYGMSLFQLISSIMRQQSAPALYFRLPDQELVEERLKTKAGQKNSVFAKKKAKKK